MNIDDIFENINHAINDARRIIEEAESALMHIEKLQRSHGITKQSAHDYMFRYLSESERRSVEEEVQRSLNEIRDAAEDVVRNNKKNSCQSIKYRIGDRI